MVIVGIEWDDIAQGKQQIIVHVKEHHSNVTFCALARGVGDDRKTGSGL